ncbi:putative retrotransposon protein [Tanacetum coccineum]
MVQPEGFVNLKHPNQVCELKRSIYRLKQASRQWNKWFNDETKKFGFTKNQDEPCVYMKASGSNVTFLVLYIDDILIMGNHILMLQDVKFYLGKSFAMKDLGEAACVLGIKIYRDKSRWLIGLCQSSYVEKILKRFNMETPKRRCISMQDKPNLSKSHGALTPDEIEYVLLLNGGVIDCKSTKKSILTTSSTEAKAIATAKDPGITKSAKHYRTEVHYLYEVIELDDIVLEKVYTDDNVVDSFM